MLRDSPKHSLRVYRLGVGGEIEIGDFRQTVAQGIVTGLLGKPWELL